VDAYFNLARILTSPSEHDQAVRNYETALEINPEMADCHYWFAKLLTTGERLSNDGTLLKEPKIDDAKKHFMRAIDIDPKFAKAYYRLGLLLYHNKDYSNALHNLEKAITLDPTFSKAHYSLAVLLMDKNAKELVQKGTQAEKKKKTRSVRKKTSGKESS
jgi:superkiller protein 3